jgi:hypothetical protein
LSSVIVCTASGTMAAITAYRTLRAKPDIDRPLLNEVG